MHVTSTNSQPASWQRGEIPGQARADVQAGRLGQHRVEVAQAPEPRSPNALKQAWLDIKHALASALHMQVSTDWALQGTKAQFSLSDLGRSLTSRQPDLAQIVASAIHVCQNGHPDLQTPMQKKNDGELLAPMNFEAMQQIMVANMDDMQLLRMLSAFRRYPELLIDFHSAGSRAYEIAKEDHDRYTSDPTRTMQDKIGKAADLAGVFCIDLYVTAKTEFARRGLVADLPREDARASQKKLDHIVYHAMKKVSMTDVENMTFSPVTEAAKQVRLESLTGGQHSELPRSETYNYQKREEERMLMS